MSAATETHPGRPPGLEAALAEIAAGAAARDAEPQPRFPEDAIARLEAAGALAVNAEAGESRPPAAGELGLVRAIARADSSVGRIVDGHLNGVERLAVQGPGELAAAELDGVRAGRLRTGVWGGDPAPGEGPAAAIVADAGEERLRGVKTFCSGAGGLDRALVLARTPEGGPPVSVWIDLTDPGVEVDDSWYRAHGLRASVSHRVVFHDVPVLARLGRPGAIAAQPWFGRDALRTAASWAGMADRAAQSALDELAERPQRSPLEGLAAGRILAAWRAIDLWIDAGAVAIDTGTELPEIAIQGRIAIPDACRLILDEAARACGSRPFARGGDLDRARRDLELFLLQHRLEPLLARAGEAALAERAG